MFAWLSGTQTAACWSTRFLPPENLFIANVMMKPTNALLLRNKSSMHLLICAIHSCFSVLVAAYTANDFAVVRINQPLRVSNGICVLSIELSDEILRTHVVYRRVLAVELLRAGLCAVCCIFSCRWWCFHTPEYRWKGKTGEASVVFDTFLWELLRLQGRVQGSIALRQSCRSRTPPSVFDVHLLHYLLQLKSRQKSNQDDDELRKQFVNVSQVLNNEKLAFSRLCKF